jgi:hypothetical protein
MDRNDLKGRDGDRINPVLAAAGFNFHLLLRWLAALLRAIFLAALQSLVSPRPASLFTRGGTSRTTGYRIARTETQGLADKPLSLQRDRGKSYRVRQMHGRWRDFDPAPRHVRIRRCPARRAW